jgi:hypothetical protein
MVQPVEAPSGWKQAPAKAKTVTLSAPAANQPAAGSIISLPPRIKISERDPGTPTPSSAIRGRFASPAEMMRTRGASKKLPVSPPRGGKVQVTRQEAPVDPSAYYVALAELAKELLATTDVTQLRLIRQRLVEWVEDLKSVGGHDELARAVETLARQLPANPGVVAAALEQLAKNGRAGGRVAFWK